MTNSFSLSEVERNLHNILRQSLRSTESKCGGYATQKILIHSLAKFIPEKWDYSRKKSRTKSSERTGYAIQSQVEIFPWTDLI